MPNGEDMDIDGAAWKKFVEESLNEFKACITDNSDNIKVNAANIASLGKNLM